MISQVFQRVYGSHTYGPLMYWSDWLYYVSLADYNQHFHMQAKDCQASYWVQYLVIVVTYLDNRKKALESALEPYII